MFKDYNIEYKITNNNNKARVAVVLQSKIKYTRLLNLESNNNSTMVLKIRQTNRKYFILIATYREWRHMGEEEALSKEGIMKQVERMKEISKIVDNASNLNLPIIWAGDVNIDMNNKKQCSKKSRCENTKTNASRVHA